MFHSQILCNNILRKLQLHSTVLSKRMIPNRPHARLTGGSKGTRRLSMHHLICSARDHTFQPNPALSSERTSSITSCHIPVIVHTEITTPTVTIDSAHDANTGSWQYVVADPYSKIGVIIDPILDFDENMCTIGTDTADRLLSLVRTKGYRISRILETHTHTDHFSASSYIQTILERDHCYRPLTCIGKRARQVRQMISQRYGVPANMFECTFDELLDDDGSFTFGCLRADVLHLPGHTSDHVGFVIEDNVFCGDVFGSGLAMPICDYSSGNAKELYYSTCRLLDLPSHYRLWRGHDHTTPTHQCPIPYLSVEEQKQCHYHVHQSVPEQVPQGGDELRQRKLLQIPVSDQRAWRDV